jgi:hypothetical protein
MIKCDDINKKNKEKCSSPAKFMVKLNKETEYIHPRCGRHGRNIDKIPIINEHVENKEKIKKGRKPKPKINEEINITVEKVEDKYVNTNDKNKLEKLFLKIDELCDLLNKTDINDK